MIAVGSADNHLHAMFVAAVRLHFLNDISQSRLADCREDHLFHRTVRLPGGRFGYGVEQVCLARDLLDVFQQFGIHFLFGAGAYPVRNVDQQIDQGVGDLALPLPAKRGQ
jgi:hypothetical protein